MLVVARHAQGASERLTVEDDEALVAVANLRDVALAHNRPALEARDRLQNRVEVAVAGVRVKDPFAAMAVERLDDHLAALFLHEALEARDFVSDDGGRDRAGEIERVELFVSFAQAGRLVEDEGTLAVGETQDHGGVEIGRVGGRILAHEDGVEGLQRILRAVIEELEMRRRAGDFAAPRFGERLDGPGRTALSGPDDKADGRAAAPRA